MAMVNPQRPGELRAQFMGRRGGGPRESPEKGLSILSRGREGKKARVRSETFADHYSQARQFYISQTATEQEHIIASFTFELSKVERPEISGRMVAHLINVDEDLAAKVARQLRLKPCPKLQCLRVRLEQI